MFQNKKYQEETLNVLNTFLNNARIYGAENTFKEMTRNIEYKPIDSMPNVPYICLRIPTGGGKTFLATQSINLATKIYLEKEYPVVLWLTPSKQIKKQTVETLKNPKHPNRQILDNAFDSNVRVFDIEDFRQVKPSDIKNNVCIVVSTIQSFRYEETEGHKKYEHNENLDTHFVSIPKDTNLPLDKFDDGQIKYSFVNVLAMHNPLIIVDEAHNNTSDLSYDTLCRLNPSCIIEYTATPNLAESNVLHSVSAMELKLEEMIKLPIMLTEYQSWQESIEACIVKRNGLAKIADSDKDYIRPIVLIQAENKDKEVTVDVIKKYLVENGNVSEERIAIATGDQRELDKFDNILSADCPIEYVITKDALKEGWDCPFAYIFCSVASVNSKIKVEQFLGRVLRMPYAEKRQNEDLNRAYAFVSSISWPNAVAKLCDKLTNMGFNETEAEEVVKPEPKQIKLIEDSVSYEQTIIAKIDERKLTQEQKEVINLTVQDDGTTAFKISVETPVEIIECVKKAISKKDLPELEHTVAVLKNIKHKESPAEKGEIIEIPQLKLCIDGEWQLGDGDAFLQNGWNLLDYPAKISESEFSINDNGSTTEIDISINGKQFTEKRCQTTLALGLEKIESTWSIEDLSRWVDRKMENQIDISMPVKLEFIRRTIQYLVEERKMSLSLLVMRKFLVLKAIEEKIKTYRQEAKLKNYQLAFFTDTYSVQTSFDYTFKFDKYNYPFTKKYNGNKIFSKHLYGVIADFDTLEEEYCAFEIDSMPEVKYWVRNIAKHPNQFRLPTSTDYFYPDFVAVLNDGRIYVIEYKGAGFYSSDDSKEKRNIGQLWAEKSNGKCLFKMVTSEKESGKSVIAQIKEEL